MPAESRGLLVIGKLLRKAETTDSAAEAEALLVKAQELATRYSIDLARARHADAQAHARELVTEREVALGRPGQPHLAIIGHLFTGIARLNDVTVLMRGTGALVYPVGLPSDLDAVEALHASLATQLARAADDWLDTGEYRSSDLHRTTARGLFARAFVERVLARLEAARDEAMDAALREAGEPPAGRGTRRGHSSGEPRSGARASTELSSTALALRAKQREVDDFLAEHYPRLGTRRARLTRRTGTGARRAGAAGRAAGDRAHLRGQRPIGS